MNDTVSLKKLAGKPVLIVEDNEVVGSFLVDVLKGLNALPFLVKDGNDAVQVIDNSIFSVVIMDWNLPGKNGGELCRYIRSNENYLDCIVLIITGNNTQGVFDDAFRSGADDYLIKPITMEMLLVRFKIMLAQHDQKVLRRKAEYKIMKTNEQLEDMIKVRTEQLVQSQGIYQSIMDNINVGIVFLDRNFKIHNANPQMKKWFATCTEESVFCCYCAIHDLEKPCDFCPVVRCFNDNEIHRQNYEYTVNEEPRHFRIIACPVESETNEVGNAVAIVSDITDMVENEVELKRRLEIAERNAGKLVQDSLCDLVGSSVLMNNVYDRIKLLAKSRKTVLLLGDTGTGKELCANALHELADWKNEPFLSVNCGSLPESILESELFGHTKGSFTGAHCDKVGLFVAAGKGTIFLDEIEAASFHTQVALLRVLDQKEVMPIGGRVVNKIEARIIIASNKDLEGMVAAGEFREDLFYRVCAETISLPPLKDRVDDIELLATYFFNEDSINRVKRTLSKKALAALKKYSWPGNVREFKNLMHTLIMSSLRPLIQPADLPEQYRESENPELPTLAQNEKELLEQILRYTSWNKSDAAQLLDISRNTVYSLIKKHGIDPE